jgi:hypothetical protein
VSCILLISRRLAFTRIFSTADTPLFGKSAIDAARPMRVVVVGAGFSGMSTLALLLTWTAFLTVLSRNHCRNSVNDFIMAIGHLNLIVLQFFAAGPKYPIDYI